jgi:3-hydroxyacyl-[acyl-carrier-protein] dehydratase
LISLDVNEIRKYLPHRYPFLLVDRVIECEPCESLVAIKNVTVNEPFFEGHFPHRPVMPGVLILEALAQASAILASTEFDPEEIDVENRIYLFAGLDKARFKRPVEPGDQLRIETKITRRIRNMWKCDGQATVDGELACRAQVMFTYKDL